ncbi:MAG TPA: hypothetical protein DEQ02_10850 [Ruminococcaceae bacterium]|nr:hypothetical protein [Oscillospiraceae bacterium]
MFGILCYNQKPINNVFKGLVSMLQITGVRAKITKVENPNLVKLIRLGNYQDILFSRLRVPPGETDLDPLSSTEHFNSITTDHGCAFLFAADPNIGEYWGYTTYLRLNIYWEEIK